MRKRAIFILLTVLLFPASSMFIQTGDAAGNAILSVTPNQILVSFPQSFILNVSIANVQGLNAWQVKLLFNPSVLMCTNVTMPQDNILGDPSSTMGLSAIINNTLGSVLAFNGLWGGGGGVNGSGTVCQILFNVTQPSISSVVFTDFGMRLGTVLYDTSQPPNLIPFDTVNGFVQVNATGFQSNIFQTVKKGVTYNVTIFTNDTASNFNYNETSDIMTFIQTGPSGSKGSCTALIPLDLMNASYLAVLINGTATYFSVFKDGTGRFIMFAYNHSTVEARVLSTLGGDLNGDRKVDMRDVATAAYSFGSSPGVARWNPIADTNGDLKIDMKDIAFVAKHFGQNYQPT